MAAPPPPPPPPPPPGPSNVGKPDNKKLLDSICKGTALKKVPDSVKNDRSAAVLNKPQGSSGPRNNAGPLIPPSGKPMSIIDEIASRKNSTKVAISPSVSQSSPNFLNSKKIGVPLPNAVPPQSVPPPPSATKKPVPVTEIKSVPPPNLVQPPPPMKKPVPSTFPPPSHKVANPVSPPNFIQPPITVKKPVSNMKPVPSNFPPALQQPIFRPPNPICSKSTINNERSQIRVAQSNQFRGPIIPPPPPMLPPSNEVRPPRFAPPPPPPFTMSIPSVPSDKPNLPIRTDSNFDFDSRFTFIDVKSFPGPNSVIKIRQT